MFLSERAAATAHRGAPSRVSSELAHGAGERSRRFWLDKDRRSATPQKIRGWRKQVNRPDDRTTAGQRCRDLRRQIHTGADTPLDHDVRIGRCKEMGVSRTLNWLAHKDIRYGSSKLSHLITGIPGAYDLDGHFSV
jgi:hypothetical protein